MSSVRSPNRNKPIICERCGTVGPLYKNWGSGSGWCSTAVSRTKNADGSYKNAFWCSICRSWLSSRSSMWDFEYYDGPGVRLRHYYFPFDSTTKL